MFKVAVFFVATVVAVVIASKGDPIYDLSIVPKNCVNAPPVEADYEPTGTEWIFSSTQISSDMIIYETLNKTSTKILIAAYDIFGFHPNTKQVADILAQEGTYRIIMPDYFRGSPFTVNNFPPKDRREISKFLAERGDWEDSVKNETLAIIDHYKRNENATSFGIFGWCWGGKIALRAAIELDDIKVAGLVHPASVTPEEAPEVRAPMTLLPSANEPDLIPFYEILQQNLGPENCGHRRFDLPHGFAGARGNFSDPVNVAAVDEVITILHNFVEPRLT